MDIAAKYKKAQAAAAGHAPSTVKHSSATSPDLIAADTAGAADDCTGTGEEDFEVGMKQNAMEYDAADVDQDSKLDFDEFCKMIRDREQGAHTDEELRTRFDQLDSDGSGKIEVHEYLQFSLKDSLARSSERVCDLFKRWDEDKSGSVDKREFIRAIKSLGFDIPEQDIALVFDQLDDDKSGHLEYKELNTMLRKGSGASAAQRNLSRNNQRRDGGPGAKLTAKNLNANFDGNRVAALPPMVRLDPGEGGIPEQLNAILAKHSVKLIDLFRDWDMDGNGAIDKKEFRMAVTALGYDVEKKDMDAAFDLLDDVKDGFIEYNEFKQALSKNSKKSALGKSDNIVAKYKAMARQKALDEKKAAAAAAGGDAAADDVANGEEEFASAMRNNAIDYDAADLDQDNKLNFMEFCFMIRDREVGEHKDEDLRKRFDALDDDGSGTIDMHEFLQWSLKDSLQRSSDRVVDIFKKWDEDKSGSVDKKEFCRAIKSLGFDIPQEDCEKVFDALDDDRSGKLEYKELNEMLRKGVGSEKSKNRLRRGSMRGQADHGRGAKLTARNMNSSFQGSRVAALDPDEVKLDPNSGVSIQEQLGVALAKNSAKLVDLFREWDDDGNGAIDKNEFRESIAYLGYKVSKKQADGLFEALDESGDGYIEYPELKKALHKFMKKATDQERTAPKPPKKKVGLMALIPPAPTIPAAEEGGELILEPSNDHIHTHTIIFLHSTVGEAEMYSRLYRRFGHFAGGLKFVFPRAPRRKVALKEGSPAPDAPMRGCWYTPATRPDDEDQIDMAQLSIQTKRIHGILDRECALLKGDTSKLVLGGTHMGGSLAAHAALSYRANLAAVVCLRSVLLKSTHQPIMSYSSELLKAPFFVFAADCDHVHPLPNVRQSFELVKNQGFPIEWHVEPELTHSADCLNEQRYVAYWIARVCLGPKQGDALRQVIHVVRTAKPAPPVQPKPQRRPVSARLAPKLKPPPVEDDVYARMAHALLREPSWRLGPFRGAGGADWDLSKAPGLVTPFSPLHSRPDAMTRRFERGGPLLGRFIRQRPHTARPQMQADVVPPAPAPAAPESARPQSARPAWNDNVSLPVGCVRPQSAVRPELDHSALHPGLVPRRPMSAAVSSPRRALPTQRVSVKSQRTGFDDDGNSLSALPSAGAAAM